MSEERVRITQGHVKSKEDDNKFKLVTDEDEITVDSVTINGGKIKDFNSKINLAGAHVFISDTRADVRFDTKSSKSNTTSIPEDFWVVCKEGEILIDTRTQEKQSALNMADMIDGTVAYYGIL
jgi:hypothetical protein